MAFDVLSFSHRLSEGEIVQRLADKYDSEQLRSVHEEWVKIQPTLASHEEPESEEDIRKYINRLIRKISSDITLTISQKCNLGCRYCYAQGGTFGLDEGLMSEEVVLRSVDYLMEQTDGIDHVGIIFFGGEPLINFKLLRKVVEYSQDVGRKLNKRVSYSMTTNATLLTEEIVDFIQRYRFGLKISLDGPSEVQDYFRPFQNGRGTYEITERKVKILMAKRRSVSARPTLIHQNLAINKHVEFFEKLGFTRVGFGIATGRSFHKSAYDLTEEDLNIVLTEDEIAAENIFQRISQGRRTIYNPFEEGVRDIHERRRIRIRCGLGRGCRTVSINGEFYPCHRFVGMEKYIIGDIYSGIDKGKVFDMLRNYYRTKDACQKCWAKHICGGACPWYVAHEDGSFRYPDRAHCNSVRASLEQSMWFYQEIKNRFPDYFKKLVSEE